MEFEPIIERPVKEQIPPVYISLLSRMRYRQSMYTEQDKQSYGESVLDLLEDNSSYNG